MNEANQGRPSLEGDLNAGHYAIPIPSVETSVVESFNRAVRSDAAIQHFEFTFERRAIAIPRRELTIQPTQVLTIAIAKENLQGQRLPHRLLEDDPVFFERVAATEGEAVAIAGPQTDLFQRTPDH